MSNKKTIEGLEITRRYLTIMHGKHFDQGDTDLRLHLDAAISALREREWIEIDKVPESFVSRCAEDHIDLMFLYEDRTMASGHIWFTGEGTDFEISSNHAHHKSMVVTHARLPQLPGDG